MIEYRICEIRPDRMDILPDIKSMGFNMCSEYVMVVADNGNCKVINEKGESIFFRLHNYSCMYLGDRKPNFDDTFKYKSIKTCKNKKELNIIIKKYTPAYNTFNDRYKISNEKLDILKDVSIEMIEYYISLNIDNEVVMESIKRIYGVTVHEIYKNKMQHVKIETLIKLLKYNIKTMMDLPSNPIL